MGGEATTESFAGIDIRQIIEKCEQVWNERAPDDAEFHAIMEFIHRRAKRLEGALPLIVRAVNSHAALVEALKESIGLIEFFHGQSGWADYNKSPEMTRFRAALALAEGV